MNVRPLLLLVGALALGILSAPVAPPLPFLVVVLALCLLAGALLWRRPRGMLAASLCAVVLFGAIHARFAAAPARDDVSRRAGGPPVWVLGTITSDVETKPGRRAFVLSVRGVDDGTARRKASGRLRIWIRDGRGLGGPRAAQLFYGDAVWLRGPLEAPPAATNPGGFDYAAFLARQGIFATLTARRAGDVRVAGGGFGSPAHRLAAWLRSRAQAASAHHLSSGDAALLDGLLLGVRGNLPGDLEDAFGRTGTVHVLSTSGLHLALLGAFLGWLAGVLLLPRALANTGIFAVIWVYALAAGAGPAVTRSALMLSLVLLAPLLRRNADALNSLLFAAFVILLGSPLALFDAGTQLSFCTVATLLAWMPLLEHQFFPWEPHQDRGARGARGVLGGLVVGVAAQAGSWPLVAWHFNLFSLVAPVANLFVAPLTGILLLVGLTGVPLAGIRFLGPLVYMLVLGPGLWLLRFLVLGYNALPWAAVSLASPPAWLIVAYYTSLWGAAPVVRKHVWRKTLFAPAAVPAASAGDLGGVAATKP